MKTWAGKFITYTLLLLGVLIISLPIYITFATVFKTPLETAQSYYAFPSEFRLDNLKTVLSMPTIWTAISNSFIITIISVSLIIILVPMVSYPISRNFNRKYYRFLFYLFIAGMFVPSQMLMLPTVKMMTAFNLTNPIGLTLIYLTASLIQGVFLCVGYLRTIPMELEEAAHMDGCGTAGAFFKVIYPVMSPIVVTVLIVNALFIWNEFLLPVILLNKDTAYWTLPLLQYNLKARTDLGVPIQFSSYIFSIGPILLLYIFTQRYIISGITEGSLKG